MAFNSNSYRRNKHRRQACAELERARDSKRHGEIDRIRFHVTIARLEWRQYLSYLRIDRMNKDHREMSAADFIAKYSE